MSKNKEIVINIKDTVNNLIDKNLQLFTREELERVFFNRDMLIKVLRDKLS